MNLRVVRLLGSPSFKRFYPAILLPGAGAAPGCPRIYLKNAVGALSAGPILGVAAD
jgi:hypothetical protein